MSYNKQNFENGQVLKAEHLNHIEDGIANQSWNDLKDKPFGDGYGDTVTFDGNGEGKVNVGGMMFKVSDAVPTYADFLNGGSLVMNGMEMPFTEEDIPPEEEMVYPNGVIALTGVYIIPPSMAGVEDESTGFTYPEAGTYFAYAIEYGLIMTKLQLNGYTAFECVNKIEEKYIPTITEAGLKLKTFYIGNGNDPYLYTDPAKTTKATNQDIPDTNLFNIAAATDEGFVMYWCTPCMVDSVVVGASFGYRCVYYFYATVIRMAYTAEYTPEEATNE